MNLLGVLVAFLGAAGLSALLASSSSPFTILDKPTSRSLHMSPTPRTGGVAVLAAIAVGWLMIATGQQQLPSSMIWMLSAAALVALVSFVDDLRGLPPLLRLCVHMLAAAILVFGIWEGNGTTALLLFLATVWMINLYNFMDGMDGFAGGMSAFGFFFLGLAGWLAGDTAFAWHSWVVGSAALGFLLLNFPPARIFMGDVGSATLGLLAGGFSLWGMREGIFAWWFPLLVFSPFVVDATVTLMRRLLRRERVWQAHRSHYYQRLVQAGWGHRRTVLAEYALMLLAGCTALAMKERVGLVLLGFILWGGVYALLMLLVDFCVGRVKAGR